MSKKTNDLQIWFNIVNQAGISPNDFYCLHCVREKVSPSNINISSSVVALMKEGLVAYSDKNNFLQTTRKGNELLDKAESFFSVKKKSTEESLMGSDYQENVALYSQVFPAIKLPSGKPGRSNKKAITECFKWFFENYDYSWEVILKATNMYVDHFQSKRYMYMQTSQYFIRKQNQDKTWRSDLADWCEMVINGEDVDNQDFFKEKVV